MILASEGLENYPRVRRRWYTIRVLRQLNKLLDDSVFAALNPKFVDHAVEMEKPEIGWFNWVGRVNGFMIQPAGIEPV